MITTYKCPGTIHTKCGECALKERYKDLHSKWMTLPIPAQQCVSGSFFAFEKKGSGS